MGASAHTARSDRRSSSAEEQQGVVPMSDVSRQLRIGIMGGTFDPIHHGYLVAASEVQHAFGLHEVVFVPTWNQPFKKDRHVTPAEHRYN